MRTAVSGGVLLKIVHMRGYKHGIDHQCISITFGSPVSVGYSVYSCKIVANNTRLFNTTINNQYTSFYTRCVVWKSERDNGLLNISRILPLYPNFILLRCKVHSKNFETFQEITIFSHNIKFNISVSE